MMKDATREQLKSTLNDIIDFANRKKDGAYSICTLQTVIDGQIQIVCMGNLNFESGMKIIGTQLLGYCNEHDLDVEDILRDLGEYMKILKANKVKAAEA